MTNEQIIKRWQEAEALQRAGNDNGRFLMNEMLTVSSACPACGKPTGQMRWDEHEFFARCGFCRYEASAYKISPFHEAFQWMLRKRQADAPVPIVTVKEIVIAGLKLAKPKEPCERDDLAMDLALNTIEKNGVTNVLIDDPDDLQELKWFLMKQVPVSEWHHTEEDEWGDFIWLRSGKPK